MPTTSPAGWNLIFSDNFNTNVAAGSFPGTTQVDPPYGTTWTGGPYASTWTAYLPGWQDTTGAGTYEVSNLRASDSCLNIGLKTVGTTIEVANPNVILPGHAAYAGQLYGMYSVCFRADPGLQGLKTAWLLWPDNDIHADGEIDFPEGDLDGTIGGYVHNITGDPTENVLAVSTPDTYLTWHVATIEWTAAGVTFILDGKVVGTTTTSPSVPMHWVLQTETSTDGTGPPAPSVAGNVYVDWVAIYSPAG
jgi:hypothetical protein